jgi:hypothetical protein
VLERFREFKRFLRPQGERLSFTLSFGPNRHNRNQVGQTLNLRQRGALRRYESPRIH